jgi:uncharacterized protein (DUF1800 family)
MDREHDASTGPQESGGGSARIGRRQLLGGAIAAGSVAVAYAALGDPLGIIARGRGSKDDASAIEQESVQISHLLRRAGFGVSREEHDRYQAMGLQATLDEVLNYQGIDDSVAEDLAATFTIDSTTRGLPQVWWLTRMANTKRPLQEKMTFFWHGLLTSQISEVRDPVAMVTQNEFLRANAMARFPDILKGIARDPAMMTYLDIDGSRRQAPNENYARELMELFALGVGNYTEADVREAARAFTGWNVPRQRTDGPAFLLQEPVFRPGAYDNGTKTFLGQTGAFEPDDIVDIIVKQPASARYIVGRLFSFFVWPDPTDADLQPFLDVYEASDMRIGAVVEAMLRSDVFYSPKAYRAIVKSPVEYAVGALKALGLEETITQLFPQGQRNQGGGQLTAMGQTLFEPPNVAGWPGGTAWLNSATIFARLNFINAVTGGTASAAPQGRPGQQPQGQNAAARRQQQQQQAQAANALPAELGTAGQALAHYLPMIADDNLPDDARQVLLDYAGGGATALDAARLRGLVYLVLASPQFHLS